MRDMVRGDKYQGVLKVGQRVHCILYGGNDGIISAINGEQRPETIRQLGGGCVVMGGRATMEVVFHDHVSHGLPESILRGVQWYISPEIADHGEILSLASEAALNKLAKEQKEKRAAESRAERRNKLPMQYPYLQVEVQGTKISGYALGAKNLKEELKRAFPSIKFSIRSKGYSGGCSIDVSWTDGPKQEQVREFTRKYQEGSFDGMEDIYNYDRENIWPDVFGGAKYVSESRHESKALRMLAAERLGYKLTDENFDQWDNLKGLEYEDERRIYREAREISCMEATKETPKPKAGPKSTVLQTILAD